jgi:hypothetical protein
MRLFAAALSLLLIGIVYADPPAPSGESSAKHWSFQPPLRATPPSFKNAKQRKWVRNPIDAFVLDRLVREKVEPAPEADRRTLIRRVTFDLTGLPPTPAEVEAFVKDTSPDAYTKLVERLLASPHYGERWGRHWLDAVRFGETEGFEYDRLRAGAWRFRDYVIKSFNDDKPFDRFVREQIAGDELDPENQEMLVAAGFHRLGPVRRNAGNPETAFSRNELIGEMAEATGAAFLGLTVGCARCHDHKFDPIAIEEYYEFQAFWAVAQEHDKPLADADTVAKWKEDTARVQAEVSKLKLVVTGKTGDALVQARARVFEAERKLPPPLPTISTIRNEMDDVKPVRVLKRGNSEKPGEEVGARVFAALFKEEPAELPARTKNPRTVLAEAIANRDNPLTARVMVNRIWQGHFGTGLVNTANDFGANGGPPSHPELLDWLACEFVENQWSVKHLHRVILMSSAYRQAEHHPAAKTLAVKDPNMPRRRLTAEETRDAMLVIAGRLNLKAGGPSVTVPVDDDLTKQLYAPGQWVVTPDRAEHDRRSVYLLAKRNLRLPFMIAFDQPDAAASCARRESSTHALQTLELMNGTLANDLAKSFAARIEKEAGTDANAQVDVAFQLAAGRSPTPREKKASVAFLKTQPLREFALAVFNLNAFLYVE